MATQQTTVSPIGFFIRAPGALGAPSPLLADNINPETRDFASLFTGLDPIDAQVQLAVTTVRASGSAVEEDGIANLPDKMTNSVEDEITSAVKVALGRLIRNGDIEFLGMTFDLVDEGNQTVLPRARYRNLRAVDQATRFAALPVPGKKRGT